MKNQSIWLDNINLGQEKSLEKNLDVDVLIIGGGITGLNTAYEFINKGLKVALVEKNQIGMGVTSKTTAKITYLQENIYTKLKKYHNEEIAKLYLDSQLESIEMIKDRIEKNNIDCDFYKTSSYFFTNDQEQIKIVKDEKNLLEKFGIIVSEETKLANNKKVKYAIKVDNTYVFHPLKYLKGLKKVLKKNKIQIYENTKINTIDKQEDFFISKTDDYLIKSKTVILTLHYPYFIYPFFFPLKTTLEKSYICAKKCHDFFKFSAINIEKPKESIRYHKDKKSNYEITLTASHNIAFKNNEEKNFSQLLKNDKYDYAWSNIDIITDDYLPYIGKIDSNLLIGTGYNKWGMTNSILAGKVLCDIVLGKENKYIDLLNPKRGINLVKIINFPVTIGSSLKSFIGSKINKNKSWYNSNVKFEIRNNKSVGIYIDDNNKEHIVYNKCPHLKCSLIFNEVEKTWDCPCHGSRFDLDGKCIEGPSNYNICYKKDK